MKARAARSPRREAAPEQQRSSRRASSPAARGAGTLFLQRCACGGSCPRCQTENELSLQPKLRVGLPGDRYEQEADRVAERVMYAPAAIVPLPVTPLVQRTGSGVMTAPPAVDAALAAPGRPLDGATRQFMEARFGHDFAAVRVHADAQAASSAAAVGARAFTVGRDVVFGAGAYAPGTAEGRHLLAHELTHVVQQQNGRSALVQRIEGLTEDEDLALGVELTEGIPPLDAPPFPSEQVGDYEFASLIGKDLWWKVQVVWAWTGANRFTAVQLLIEFLETLDSFRPILRRVAPDKSTLDWLIEEINYTLDLMWELEPEDPFLSERFATIAGYLRDLDFQFEEVEEAERGDEQPERLHQLLDGLLDGVSSFGSGQLTQFGQRLDDVFIYKHPLLSKLYFQGGMVWGVVEQASKVVKVIFDLMTPEGAAPHEQALREAVAAFKSLVTEMLGPNAGQMAYDIGKALGAQIPNEIAALNKEESDLDFAYKLGQKVGPVFVEAVLSLLGFEAFVAARVIAIGEKVLDAFVDLKRLKSLLPVRALRHADLPDGWAPVEIRIGNETHKLSIVEKNGRRFVQLCSNGCGELAEKISQFLEGFEGDEAIRQELDKMRKELELMDLVLNGDPLESREEIKELFDEFAQRFEEIANSNPAAARAVADENVTAPSAPSLVPDDILTKISQLPPNLAMTTPSRMVTVTAPKSGRVLHESVWFGQWSNKHTQYAACKAYVLQYVVNLQIPDFDLPDVHPGIRALRDLLRGGNIRDGSQLSREAYENYQDLVEQALRKRPNSNGVYFNTVNYVVGVEIQKRQLVKSYFLLGTGTRDDPYHIIPGWRG